MEQLLPTIGGILVILGIIFIYGMGIYESRVIDKIIEKEKIRYWNEKGFWEQLQKVKAVERLGGDYAARARFMKCCFWGFWILLVLCILAFVMMVSIL